MTVKAGQYVRHSKYGWGTIVDHDRDQTLVSFRRIGIKKLQTDSTTFVAVGGEAPKKKRSPQA
jgi:phosphosulfolactate synthase (CoM biosynthesis protein A)